MCFWFYDMLIIVWIVYEYEVLYVWNVDEIGLEIVVGRNSSFKVVVKKGSRNVRILICDNKEWMIILVSKC